MKRLLYFLTAVLVVASCGPSYEEKRRTIHKERMQRLKEDSAALKVAVMPTMDCLPLFVAKAEHLFSGADVRLKLYSNRMARIKKLPQLDDKMVGMTRYSATALLADAAVDSARLKPERVFKIQLNDVEVRLKMLLNGEIDAVMLTEPQASLARQAHHRMLMDSRKAGVQLGVVAFREKSLADKTRREQLDVFLKGYNQAVDSLNHHGLSRYRNLVVKYCHVKENQIDSVLRNMKYQRISAPKEADVERARKWLEKQ